MATEVMIQSIAALGAIMRHFVKLMICKLLAIEYYYNVNSIIKCYYK